MYRMFLRGTATVEIPVLPDEMKVDSPGENMTAQVLRIGVINRLRKQGLRTVSWDGVFPARRTPLVTAEKLWSPAAYVKTLQGWRWRRETSQLILAGFDMDLDMRVSVEDFTYSMKGGEPGDIYYSITLKEFRDYSAREVKLTKNNKVTVKNTRTVAVAHKRHQYTVQHGDTLLLLARREYGDDQMYTAIYEENKGIIDGMNSAKGAAKYSIWPGQVLMIP